MSSWSGIRTFRPRVHHKLGLSVFATIVLFLIILEVIFYLVFTRFYVQQLSEDMIHRGHSHAYALEENWSEETLRHVAEMESYTRYVVAVTGANGELLVSSKPLEPVQMNYIRNYHSQTEYEWIERDWKNQGYLISRSPVTPELGNVSANVIMFTPTEPIQNEIQSFRTLLVWFAAVSVLSVFMLVFLFSQWISRPLMNMKNVILKLSRNDYRFELPVDQNDEIGELNRSIMKLSAELQHYRSERQQFLAEISHELRTPITYIRGYADVLQNKKLDEDDKRKYLRYIHEAAGRLHRLIHDLYELTRLDQVQVQIQKETINLTSFLQHIYEEQRSFFETSKVGFYEELPIAPVYIHADANRLAQVVMNTLENARKYTPEGGRVTLRMTSSHRNCFIEVADTGIGIPEEELPHIWRGFYRVEKSRSRDYGGAGLGLAIAKRIVELHGGSIEAHSREEEGTLIRIQLPLHPTNN